MHPGTPSLDFLLAVDDAWCGNGPCPPSQGYISSSSSMRSLLVAGAHWACEIKYKIGKVEENFLGSGA